MDQTGDQTGDFMKPFTGLKSGLIGLTGQTVLVRGHAVQIDFSRTRQLRRPALLSYIETLPSGARSIDGSKAEPHDDSRP